MGDCETIHGRDKLAQLSAAAAAASAGVSVITAFSNHAWNHLASELCVCVLCCVVYGSTISSPPATRTFDAVSERYDVIARTRCGYCGYTSLWWWRRCSGCLATANTTHIRRILRVGSSFRVLLYITFNYPSGYVRVTSVLGLQFVL